MFVRRVYFVVKCTLALIRASLPDFSAQVRGGPRSTCICSEFDKIYATASRLQFPNNGANARDFSISRGPSRQSLKVQASKGFVVDFPKKPEWNKGVLVEQQHQVLTDSRQFVVEKHTSVPCRFGGCIEPRPFKGLKHCTIKVRLRVQKASFSSEATITRGFV